VARLALGRARRSACFPDRHVPPLVARTLEHLDAGSRLSVDATLHDLVQVPESSSA